MVRGVDADRIGAVDGVRIVEGGVVAACEKEAVIIVIDVGVYPDDISCSVDAICGGAVVVRLGIVE